MAMKKMAYTGQNNQFRPRLKIFNPRYYGIGRKLTYQDRFAVESLVNEARKNDYKVRDMILAVCKSDLFVGRSNSE